MARVADRLCSDYIVCVYQSSVILPVILAVILAVILSVILSVGAPMLAMHLGW
jgi:hypothetical protein